MTSDSVFNCSKKLVGLLPPFLSTQKPVLTSKGLHAAWQVLLIDLHPQSNRRGDMRFTEWLERSVGVRWTSKTLPSHAVQSALLESRPYLLVTKEGRRSHFWHAYSMTFHAKHFECITWFRPLRTPNTKVPLSQEFPFLLRRAEILAEDHLIPKSIWVYGKELVP